MAMPSATKGTEAASVMPYDHEIYHRMTGRIGANVNELKKRGGTEIVNTKVRDCFIKHGVHKYLCASVNHRHFDLTEHERNVEEAGGKAVASSDHHGTPVISWLFAGGRCYPYEYRREPLDIHIPAAFVKEHGLTLNAHGLDDLLGFGYYEDGIVGYEKTDVEARISTTTEQQEWEPGLPNMAPSSWAFFPQ